MADPWLTIIGIGEDGLAGLSDASRNSLASAEAIFGGERHLALIGGGERCHPWPVPFDTRDVLARRGRPTVVLASGDPFWFGAGGGLASLLGDGEWVAYPASSVFSLMTARLGWRLENVACLGLHAAPFEQLLPHLARGARLVCLVRDGNAVGSLAAWLTARGWGESRLSICIALGGPSEHIERCRADRCPKDLTAKLVTVAVEADGGEGLPRSSGLPDELFAHDGQITKRPIRALALSALAPRAGERLWDIGAGSGSMSVEWALCGGFSEAVEAREDRAATIRSNLAAFGLADKINLTLGQAPAALTGLPLPQAVFFGGGLDQTMFDTVRSMVRKGTRLVAHAVTLETEALLVKLHHDHGGDLMRVEIAHAAPLGRFRSWATTRPVVQWSAMT